MPLQRDPDAEVAFVLARRPALVGDLRSPARSETTIALAWDAATDDVGVAGYRLYGPGGATGLAGTSTTVTGLAVGTSYDFQVAAFDETGNESARSPVLAVATLPPDTQDPTTPQNLRSPLQTGSTIELAWDASSDDRGVAGYRVYDPVLQGCHRWRGEQFAFAVRRPRKQPKYVEPRLVERLLALSKDSPRDQLVIRLMTDAGLRREEVINLRVSHVGEKALRFAGKRGREQARPQPGNRYDRFANQHMDRIQPIGLKL